MSHPPEPGDPRLPGGRTSPRWRRALLPAFLVLAVGLAVVALGDQWARVGEGARQLSVPGVAGALALALASLAANALAFHAALSALGSDVPVRAAARIYLVGQLGKYVPGSVWPVVAQMQLGAKAGVTRARAAAASLLTLGVGVVGAVPVALLAAPVLVREVDSPPALELAALAVLLSSLALLHPRVLSWLVRLLLRLARRPEAPVAVPGRAVARVVLRTVPSMVLAGAAVAVLAVDVGARGWTVLPVVVGGFAAASVAGLLVVPLPAGAGVRELVLVVPLVAFLPLASATVVAVSARVVLTAADLVAAGLVSGRLSNHSTE